MKWIVIIGLIAAAAYGINKNNCERVHFVGHNSAVICGLDDAERDRLVITQ